MWENIQAKVKCRVGLWLPQALKFQMTRTSPLYHLHPTVLLQGLDLMGFSGLKLCRRCKLIILLCYFYVVVGFFCLFGVFVLFLNGQVGLKGELLF